MSSHIPAQLARYLLYAGTLTTLTLLTALLAACNPTAMGDTDESAYYLSAPVPTDTGPLSGPVPPTPTPVLPPDHKTTTPIPPEHRSFFIGMGDGGSGVPAIEPRGTATNPSMPTVTEDQVRQYVQTHPLRGGHVSIHPEPNPTISTIELLTLLDVYRRYFADALSRGGWQAPHPPETLVYLVELDGIFRIRGGPPPGLRGTYQTGVQIFDAHTGDLLLEGGVGWIGD